MKTRNDLSVDLLNRNEDFPAYRQAGLPTGREEGVRKLRERFLQDVTTKIKESTNTIPSRGVFNKDTDQRKDNVESATSTTKVPDAPEKEHGGRDKINEIRKDVAAQSTQLIVSPEKQNELLEIVRQKSEEFEKELSLLSFDKSVIDSALKRFKEELTERVSKLLTPFEQPQKSADANYIKKNEAHP